MKCTTNDDTIRSYIHTEASYALDEYNSSHNTNHELVADTESIKFPTAKMAADFCNKINKELLTNVVGIDAEHADTVRIISTDNVKEIAEFESFAMHNYDAPADPASDVSEFVHSPDSLEYVKKFAQSRKEKYEFVSNKIITLYAELKQTENLDRRQELIREISVYSGIKSSLEYEKESISPKFDDLVEGVDRSLKTLDYMVRNLYSTSLPDVVQLVERDIDDIELFMKSYGSPLISDSHMADQPTAMHIKRQRYEFDGIKRRYGIQRERIDREFVMTNPIFHSSQLEDIKKAIANPDSKEFSLYFGGEQIPDINALEKFFLNIDSNSTFDGVWGETMMTMSEATAQENMNFVDKRKHDFLRFSKELKKRGINLEDGDSASVFREKDANGQDTGNLISLFMPEWRSEIVSFMTKYKSDKGIALNDILDKAEIVNIFRFGFFHKHESEMNELEQEFVRNVKSIFHNMGKNGDQMYNDFVAKFSYDPNYEEGLIRLLGEHKVNEIKDEMMLAVNEYYYRNSSIIAATEHLNPIAILMSLETLSNQKKASGNIDPQSLYIRGNQLAEGRSYNYKRLLSAIVPTEARFYNQTFRKNFVEGDDIMRECYEFLADNLKLMNSLYLGKSSLSLPKIAVNYTDEMLNAAKGLVSLEDTGATMRKLKKNALMMFQDVLFKEDYYTKEGVDVALNYSDKSKRKKRIWIDTLKGKTAAEVDEYGRDEGLSRANYPDNDAFINAIATKKSLRGFETSLFSSMMKMFDLYAAQKTRNELYPISQMILRMYKKYRNVDGRSRENAEARMEYYIRQGIQKLNMASGQSISGKKLEDIEFLKNVLAKFDRMPILKKIFNSSLLKRFDEDEKQLVEMIRQAQADMNESKDVEFTYNGTTFKRGAIGETRGMFVKVGDGWVVFTPDDFNGMSFNEILMKYYDNRLAELGSTSTLQNVVDLIRNLLVYKMLGGISTSGMFNRIEGHLANSEVDATGFYWNPGDLNYAERYFFGAGWLRYINSEGKHVFGRDDAKLVKRYDIVKALALKTNTFQDMKNQFDRTIEGEQKGVTRHNLDLMQFAVENPEFKNQMSILIARMMSEKIKDKYGNEHYIFDRDTGEFTCYDFIDGELVLKEEFDTDENRQWVDFNVYEYDGDGNKNLTHAFKFFSANKEIIKNIHGDYRKNAVKMYNNYLIASHMMMLKQWLPQKVLRGWSQGGSRINGTDVKNVNLMMDMENPNGIWYDLVMKSKSMALLPLVLSTTQLHKGILKTVGASAANLYMFGKVVKNRLGARNGELEHNVTMLEEMTEELKAIWYELMIWVPRTIGKKSFNVAEHSFTDDKFEQEYGKYTLGNFRAAARHVATYTYLTALGVMAKLLLWNPDDGDDDTRRRMYNWVDNNMENILNATTDTLFMLDSIEDKFEVSNTPIIRWFDDVGKFIEACNDMNGDKAGKYAKKAFMPIRFSLNPFSSDFEFEKDTPSDRLIKNYKTDGEWAATQDVKNIRKDLKEQYVKMWDKHKLPEDLEKKLAEYARKDGYEDLYNIPEKVLKSYLDRILPSKRRKEYKEKSDSFMREILLKEYDKNPELQKKTMKWLFSGYDNRLGWFGRDIYVGDDHIQDDGD